MKGEENGEPRPFSSLYREGDKKQKWSLGEGVMRATHHVSGTLAFHPVCLGHR